MINKDIPVLYSDKSNCCGCSACASICPVKAISMEEDNEGFLYPIINPSLCIRCKQCLSVCGFKEDQIEKGYEII